MKSKIKNKVTAFIKKHPHISPSLTRFPIPETFWKAGISKVIFRLANYYFTYSQMVSKKERVLGYPSHLTVDVTNVCNLKCPLCPTGVGAPGRGKGMMSLAFFEKIIDEMGKYLLSVDLFNWGDPLLNKEIFDMVAYAHRRAIVTSISTNFQRFSEAAAEKAVSSGLDILILSIDGASQESYEKYRVGGDFQKVIRNISLLVDKKRKHGVKHPYICWQFLVMRHNEHEISAAEKMAAALGIDKITFDHAYLPVATRHEAVKWLPQNPKYHRYNLEELERTWALQESREGAEKSPQEHEGHRGLRRRVNCSWLWTQATVNWDGGVSPCCALYEQSEDFGSVSDAGFKKIWNNEKYRASRRFSSKGETADIHTICMKCPLAMHG